MFQAEVIADSINPRGVRLTTMQVTYPRIILAEMNTHRRFSRNTASSRAIPIAKMIAQVSNEPYVPMHWGSNKPGMQAGDEITGGHKEMAVAGWTVAARQAVEYAEWFRDLGVHKQIVNRLLEPFMWTTQIISSTEWDNFFAQRISEYAQPEMRKIAELMKSALDASVPARLFEGDWHTPYCRSEFADVRVSAARCARVSYKTFDGITDPEKDLELYNKLVSQGHWSPLEHVAMCDSDSNAYLSRNFVKGWAQLRAVVEGKRASVAKTVE